MAIAVSVIRFCSTAVTNFCAGANVTCPGMVALAQLTRLEARIDALANRTIPSPRILYHVEIDLDSAFESVLGSDGNPVVRRPGVSVLDFEEQGWW